MKEKVEEITVKKAGPIPTSAWFIIITELCERFAFYGATLLFIPYMLKKLSLSKSEAVAINRSFQFIAYFITIIGAALADSLLGKFRTILLFSCVYLVGLLFLSASSLSASIDSGFGLIGFCLSLFLMIAWGTGGIKSNVSAFAAEQVDKDTLDFQYDYNMTVERIFRFFYWAINVGSLFGQLICPVVANNLDNYPVAFAIPAAVFFIGIIIFVAGKSTYKSKPISGNPLMKSIRVISYALKHKRTSIEKKEHWLDYAKTEEDMEWDHQFVDDLAKTLSACKVFFFYIMYWALYHNMSDNFIAQGINMKHPDWLGPEQLNIINSLVLVITLPLFDYVVFPLLRKMGYNLGLITRIAIGFALCTAGFVYVTILQDQLYKTGPYYNFTNVPTDIKFPVNNISIWWQIPAYGTIAISEIFSSATGLEYAYKYAAPQLKSVVMSLYLLTNCGGSLIGLVLAIWSRDPNYVVLFGVQTAVMGVLTIIFYFLFRKLDKVVGDRVEQIMD